MEPRGKYTNPCLIVTGIVSIVLILFIGVILLAEPDELESCRDEFGISRTQEFELMNSMLRYSAGVHTKCTWEMKLFIEGCNDNDDIVVKAQEAKYLVKELKNEWNNTIHSDYKDAYADIDDDDSCVLSSEELGNHTRGAALPFFDNIVTTFGLEEEISFNNALCMIGMNNQLIAIIEALGAQIIEVGDSKDNGKEVKLSEELVADPSTYVPMAYLVDDQFSISVDEENMKKITVTRTDKDAGWDQYLYLVSAGDSLAQVATYLQDYAAAHAQAMEPIVDGDLTVAYSIKDFDPKVCDLPCNYKAVDEDGKTSNYCTAECKKDKNEKCKTDAAQRCCCCSCQVNEENDEYDDIKCDFVEWVTSNNKIPVHDFLEFEEA